MIKHWRWAIIGVAGNGAKYRARLGYRTGFIFVPNVSANIAYVVF